MISRDEEERTSSSSTEDTSKRRIPLSSWVESTTLNKMVIKDEQQKDPVLCRMVSCLNEGRKLQEEEVKDSDIS